MYIALLISAWEDRDGECELQGVGVVDQRQVNAGSSRSEALWQHRCSLDDSELRWWFQWP